LTITEGRNRQVRRMIAAVGAKVQKLKRVQLGPLELGPLERGAWRALLDEEVRALEDAALAARRAGGR
jgi:23S rRNA pseudouridine2605 synthase